jgi:hypothetical protein
MTDSVDDARKSKNVFTHSPESVLHPVQFLHFNTIQIVMQISSRDGC